ncbi:hypothetical protein FS837_009240 [Tulasnella sp. UAMH 9824]|nr:hypothetical protein FS837_009240 [Tulasnella sp. UAMH 9824]
MPFLKNSFLQGVVEEGKKPAQNLPKNGSASVAPYEKATEFIQNLNRGAFAQGKSKDDERLGQYAVGCLSDDALMWYYGLAEEVQNSWRMMCLALLKEFSNKPAGVPAAKAAILETELEIMPEPLQDRRIRS